MRLAPLICVLDVPASNSGRHQVTFETKGIGSDAFRWALWRDPRFNWTESLPSAAAPAESTPVKASAAEPR